MVNKHYQTLDLLLRRHYNVYIPLTVYAANEDAVEEEEVKFLAMLLPVKPVQQ